MNHRIFIAVNLPENIKKELSSFQLKWPELPCRWTKKDNLHITLVFLGYVKNEELTRILELTENVAAKNEPFFIKLNKVCYGPPKKPIRMIWVVREKSERLGKLQKDLKNSLLKINNNQLKEGVNSYSPHITLGRIKTWQFRQIEPEERPEINEEIDLNFEVSSVEVMESQLKRSGPEYTILETCPLFK